MTNEKWWLADKQLQHLLTQVRTVEQDVLLGDVIPDIVAEAQRIERVRIAKIIQRHIKPHPSHPKPERPKIEMDCLDALLAELNK